MFFKKKKKNQPEKKQISGKNIFQTACHGTIEDMYVISKGGIILLEKAKAAYQTAREKSSVKKQWMLFHAWNDACTNHINISNLLQSGALQAFLEGRPENLQEIVAHPEAFLKTEDENRLAEMRLIELIKQVPDPAIPELLFAKVPEEKRQAILDKALSLLVDEYDDVEKDIPPLIAAGARANDTALADVLYKGYSQTTVDMLLENGASFEGAIKIMRADPERYEDSADRIEFLQYKRKTDATIRQLRTTIEELTAQQSGAARPAKPAQKPKLAKRAAKKPPKP